MLVAQGGSISVQVSGCDRNKTNISTLQLNRAAPNDLIVDLDANALCIWNAVPHALDSFLYRLFTAEEHINVSEELALCVAFSPSGLLVEVEDDEDGRDYITWNSFNRRSRHVRAILIGLLAELKHVLKRAREKGVQLLRLRLVSVIVFTSHKLVTIKVTSYRWRFAFLFGGH